MIKSSYLLHLLHLALVSLMMVSSVFAQETDEDMSMMQMTMDSPLAQLQGEAFEIAFMSMMTTHHQGAITMAQWILERTEDARIQGAAERIIEEQQAEIEQMMGWLQAWYGRSDADPEMAQMMQSQNEMMMAHLMEMGQENPERAFLSLMSLHHNSAIDMAQFALLRAAHPELRDLAKEVVVSQAKEIAEFQSWLQEDSAATGN